MASLWIDPLSRLDRTSRLFGRGSFFSVYLRLRVDEIVEIRVQVDKSSYFLPFFLLELSPALSKSFRPAASLALRWALVIP